MNIVQKNIAVESATCDACGAEADRQILSAGTDHGLPDGADLYAYSTNLPAGWVSETRQGGEESKRTLCGDCAGTVKEAVETAISIVPRKKPLPPVIGDVKPTG